jgi:Mrp family chromosome partitioning ATPase
MDRIRKALDRARAERQAAAAASPVAHDTDATVTPLDSHRPAGHEPAPRQVEAVADPVPRIDTLSEPTTAANEPEPRPLADATVSSLPEAGQSRRAPDYTRTRTFVTEPDRLRANRLVWPADPGPALEAYRLLRTQVMQRMRSHGYRTLGIVSPRGGAGRTLTACNLAISLAADENHTVLLVDLDLRRPQVAATFGATVDAGVDDVLAGRARVEDALIHPAGYDKLVLLPARAPMASASDILSGATVRRLCAELKSRYPDRLVIFDLPPALDADDVLAFAPNLDCALLVVGQRRTVRADVTRTFELLRNVTVVGSVLNSASSGGR